LRGTSRGWRKEIEGEKGGKEKGWKILTSILINEKGRTKVFFYAEILEKRKDKENKKEKTGKERERFFLVIFTEEKKGGSLNRYCQRKER